MTERITNRHIEFQLSLLNDVMGTPENVVTDGKHNVGNIHLYDNNIVQTKNESGGIAFLARCNTKREAYMCLESMYETVRQFRLHRGI